MATTVGEENGGGAFLTDSAKSRSTSWGLPLLLQSPGTPVEVEDVVTTFCLRDRDRSGLVQFRP